MDIRVHRPPTGQEYKHPKVEKVKEENHKKKKDDDEQNKKKKKDDKLDSIFSSLAENLSQDETGF